MPEESALLIPPAENPAARLAVIIGRGARSRSEAMFQRAPVKKLLSRLNDTLQDCAVQIGLAPRLWDAPGQWRQMTWGVHGGALRGELEGDALLAHLKAKERYRNWHAGMQACCPVGLSICVRVCQLEESIEQIRRDERISHATAVQLLQFGLNEYAIRWGRGDQIGPGT